MLENLFRHTAITAADNQDLFHVAVGKDRRMSQHLMIDELVKLSGLNSAVQSHDAAQETMFENDKVLNIGPLMMQNAANFELHHAGDGFSSAKDPHQSSSILLTSKRNAKSALSIS